MLLDAVSSSPFFPRVRGTRVRDIREEEGSARTSRSRGRYDTREGGGGGERSAAEGKLCLIHTVAFESGNLCARRSETECKRATERERERKRARARQTKKGEGTWRKEEEEEEEEEEGRERGTNVAIIIDTLACKRCLLYV